MGRYFLFAFSFVLLAALTESTVFENSNVIKTVDLSSHIVKVTLRITVHFTENDLSDYLLAIPAEEYEHLAYIDATVAKKVDTRVRFLKSVFSIDRLVVGIMWLCMEWIAAT